MKTTVLIFTWLEVYRSGNVKSFVRQKKYQDFWDASQFRALIDSFIKHGRREGLFLPSPSTQACPSVLANHLQALELQQEREEK